MNEIDDLKKKAEKLGKKISTLSAERQEILKNIEELCEHASVEFQPWKRSNDEYDAYAHYIRWGRCKVCNKLFEEHK